MHKANFLCSVRTEWLRLHVAEKLDVKSCELLNVEENSMPAYDTRKAMQMSQWVPKRKLDPKKHANRCPGASSCSCNDVMR